MAKDVTDSLNYFLLIDESGKDHLANIRRWNNLKMATDERGIWVKDFSFAQVNSVELKTIPYKRVFYEKNGKLYLLNSLLPDRNVPALLWTPIERALPIQLPPLNHNYFGVHEKTDVQVIPSENASDAVAMITTTGLLEAYLCHAPAIRLQRIRWALLDNDKVFLAGTPLLPIQGDVYWQRDAFILPAGFDLDLFLLCDALNELINPAHDNWVVWNTDGSYFLLPESDLSPLSLSSFRLSTGSFSLK